MTTSELPGLIGWWPLDDGDGKLSDRLGQFGGVVTGAVPRTHPQSDRLEPKRSLYFSRGAYAAIPDAPNVGTGDFSVCLWAKTSGYCGATEVLLDKRMENSGPVRGWCVFLYGWQLGVQLSDGSWTNFLLDSFRWQADSNWHHLAITIDRDQTDGGRWYMDGQAVGNPFAVSGRAGSLSNQFPLTLGRRSDAGGGYFGGDLSDVRLYQRVLTAEEIYQVYGSISADEPAFRVLVTPPPEVSPAALQFNDSEPLPLPSTGPQIETIPETETTSEPAVAALPEVTQPVQMDAEATRVFVRVRQKILDSLKKLSETTLFLNSNQLTHLPPEIWQLHNLQKLNLYGNRLTQLSPEIWQLQNLQSLNLGGNRLTHLPPEIWQLQNLKELELSRNQLTHLPPEIGQLHSLQKLNLDCNYLTHLPPEIGQLKSLQSLNLEINELTHLPPEIGQLHNLQSLNLRCTRLKHLPPEIGQLKSLQSLELWDNQLTQLSPEIGQLHNLQSLNLGNNQLTHLPPEIGQLHNLQSLDLFGNKLTHLPPEIGQLHNLQKLNLWDTRLTHLPPEIGQLQNLKELSLDSTRLTHLPPEIGQLHNLQLLNLQGNTIQDFSLQDFSPLSNHPNPNLRVHIGSSGVGGFSLSRQYLTYPNQWRAEWLLTEPNAEIRRMLLEGIGYDRLCQELQATELDTWREYTLLNIDEQVDVEPIHLLKMTCPSTSHIHTLRVPPNLTSAREAIKWANWDVDPEAFALET